MKTTPSDASSVKQQFKAIETRYHNVLFRSRLEARWAVYFDSLKVSWQYEREGFETPDGRYLPDFWLPQVSMWAEAKPEWPDQHAINKMQQVATNTGFPVLLLDGPPEAKNYWAVMPGCEYSQEYQGGYWADFVFTSDDYWLDEKRLYSCTGQEVPDRSDQTLMVNMEAVSAALSARFEFGAQR